MSIWEAILLGIVQGATEFLPISSDGHLVLVPEILNLTHPDLVFIGFVHLATLIAILVYFRKDLWAIIRAVLAGLLARRPLATTEARLGWYIVAGSILVGIVGLTLKDFFESVFASPLLAAIFMLFNAGILVLGERLKTGTKSLATMSWLDAILIGSAQILALLPGISRSGTTITGGLIRGLDRPTAARFAFLVGIPAILAAGLLSLYELLTAEPLYSWSVYIAAFLAAAIAGYLCISFLLSWVRQHSLYIFAFYCAAVGSIYLLIVLLQG
jgi:undecaprenyl-diphosphatase